MKQSGEERGQIRSRLDRLPPRLLPILYAGFANAALLAAFIALVSDPRHVAGFFYQPHTIALVHLIALGWVSATILGSLYIIGPMALRMSLPVRAPDYVAFALFGTGVVGMAGHFFIAEYVGIVWSAALVLAGLLYVGGRTVAALWRAPIQGAVKLHLALAFANVLAAGGFGMLLALHKIRPFLPGRPLSNLFAHLHLAGLGWATMMVFGAGYRMLPMVLPAAMPMGRSLFFSAILLESGTLGMMGGLLLEKRLLLPAAILVVAGFVAFFSQAGWMLRHRRRRPAWLELPDYGVRHVLQAMLYAALNVIVGLGLCLVPTSQSALRLGAAYGVLGLMGFLGHMVLGIQSRILPMFAAYHANLQATCDRPPTTPRDMGGRRTRSAVFLAWTVGVPLLAWGMFVESAGIVAIAGWVLLVASTLQAANAAAVLAHAFRNRGTDPGQGRPWPRPAGIA